MPSPDTRRAPDRPFDTGRVVSLAAGLAVHDTCAAFLPPLFVQWLSLSNTGAGLLSAFASPPCCNPSLGMSPIAAICGAQ